jgi:hypothetical protein
MVERARESDETVGGRDAGKVGGVERADYRLPGAVSFRNPVALLDLQRSAGNAATVRLLQPMMLAPAGGEANAASGLVGLQRVPRRKKLTAEELAQRKEAQRSELAGKIGDDVRLRQGITVAFYGSKLHSGDEFERQAKQFAKDHHAVGLSGNDAAADVAMEITRSLPDELKDLGEAISRTLLASTHVPIQTLAIFTHGIEKELEAGPVAGTPAQVSWISDVKAWVGQLTPYMTASPQVLLYACRTAGKPAKGMPFAAGVEEYLQKDLGQAYGASGQQVAPQVWAHKTRAHTTANPTLVEFGGTAEASTQHEFLQELAEQMTAVAIERAGRGAGSRLPPITEDQRSKLVQFALVHATKAFQTKPKEQETTGPKNVYIREIPSMGIVRVARDLTADATPDFSSLALSKESIAILAKGFEQFKELIDKPLAELRSRASVAGIGDYPAGRPGAV